MSAQAELLNTNTQYYSVTEPSEGELVLVKFTEQGDMVSLLDNYKNTIVEQ